MLEKVVQSIGKILKENYEDANVFTSDIKQGAKTGDFLINLLKVENSFAAGGMRKIKGEFEVKQFTKEQLLNKLSYLTKLEKLLELIEVENGIILKAYPIESKIEDKSISVTLSYSFYTYNQKNNSLLQAISFGKNGSVIN